MDKASGSLQFNFQTYLIRNQILVSFVLHFCQGSIDALHLSAWNFIFMSYIEKCREWELYSLRLAIYIRVIFTTYFVLNRQEQNNFNQINQFLLVKRIAHLC